MDNLYFNVMKMWSYERGGHSWGRQFIITVNFLYSNNMEMATKDRFKSTVQPALRGHLWDKEKVAL